MVSNMACALCQKSHKVSQVTVELEPGQKSELVQAEFCEFTRLWMIQSKMLIPESSGVLIFGENEVLVQENAV